MERIEKNYLPAAGRNWALPLYDPFVKMIGIDRARIALVRQATLQNTHDVLDIGCGTGTLAMLVKQRYPRIAITGLDPDANALERATEKARRAATSISFAHGFSDELPYPDASFDRVLSSFMFHHLERGAREKTLTEVRRVLRPNGCFHILDFEKYGGRGPQIFATTAEVLTLLSRAGFTNSQNATRSSVLFGLLRIAYYRAIAP